MKLVHQKLVASRPYRCLLLVSLGLLTYFSVASLSVGHAQPPADAPVQETPPTPVSFRSQIAPLLQEHCLACHGAKKAEGGYRVDNFQELQRAGDTGESPIPQGEEQGAELLRRLETDDESERMPAERDGLIAEQIDLFRRWVAEGAVFDGADPATPLLLVIPPLQYDNAPATYSHPLPLTAVAFTPDGNQVIVGGYHELTVWDAATGQLVRRIPNMEQRIFSVAISPDATTLAVSCGEPGTEGEVRLVKWETGEVIGVIARSGDSALDVAFRPGTDELAVASADGLIRIIQWRTLTEVRTIASHADAVNAIAWSDDGTRLVSASRDKSSKVFDATNGDLLASYSGHAAAVRGVVMTADGTQVISVGGDNKLHRWNVEGAAKVAEVALGGEAHRLVRNDSNIWIPCADHRVRRFDLTNNTVTLALEGHQDWVLSLALHPASGKVVSGDYAGNVRTWSLTDGATQQHWLAKP